MGALKDYFRGYAAHGKWANQLTLECLRPVADEDYYRVLIPGVRGMHHLLNHMIIIDELWICELRGNPPRDDILSADQILYLDRKSMEEARHRIDDELAECIDGLQEDSLSAIVEYDGYGLHWPMWVEFAHVFRHQVHHRGQMSAMLCLLGFEAPHYDPMFTPPFLAQTPVLEQLASL